MNRRRLIGAAMLGVAAPLFCWAQGQPPEPVQDASTSNRRVESYARQVSADVHDARTLLDTFPAGRTRDRMTELLSRAESRANDIQREVSRGGGGGGGGGRLRGPRVMSPEEFSS